MKDTLLVVLVPGVGREDLATKRMRFLSRMIEGSRAAARLFTPQGRAPLDSLFANDLVAKLQKLGLPVDRRTWLMRPNWQGDDAALAMLEKQVVRRTGITFLYLSDVAHAAVLHGPGSRGHDEALAQLDGHVERALNLAKVGGEHPDLALMTFGPCRAVTRCFDPVRALAKDLEKTAWLRSGRASTHLLPGRLEVVCKSWRQVERIAGRLSEEPFVNHGRLVQAAETRALGLTLGCEQLWFVPLRGVAFGREGQKGMLPIFPDAPGELGTAVLPWLTEATRDLDLAEARAGLLRHAWQLAEKLGTLDRAALPEISVDSQRRSHALADVESVLQHHALEVVEDAADVEALLGVRSREE